MSPPPALVTLGGTTLDGVLTDVERVAAAIGWGPEGTSVTAALRARLRAVHDRAPCRRRAAAHGRRHRMVRSDLRCRPLGPDMVHRAGGRDLAAATGQHSTVSTATRSRPPTPR